MDRADLALLVASLSAGFSAGGLVWQLILYRLAGARITVQLVPANLDSMGTLVRGPEKGFRAEAPNSLLKALSRLTVDLAEVRVTNIWRSAISVSDISLDFGSVPPWWRRERHTLRGFPVAIHGASADEVVRLETGATVWALFDLWPLVQGVRERKPGERVTVRASAKPAGRRARRSPWRRRWTLESERSSLHPDTKAEPQLIAYQALWRSMRGKAENLDQVPLAWHAIKDCLNENASVEEIAENLQVILGPGQQLTAYDVLQAFRESTSDRSSPE